MSSLSPLLYMFYHACKEWSSLLHRTVIKEVYHQSWLQKPKVYLFFPWKYYKGRIIVNWISINLNQCHFNYPNQCPTTLYLSFCSGRNLSFQAVIVNNNCFLSLGSFMCTGPATFAHWLRQLITVILQRDESYSFLFTFPTR